MRRRLMVLAGVCVVCVGALGWSTDARAAWLEDAGPPHVVTEHVDMGDRGAALGGDGAFGGDGALDGDGAIDRGEPAPAGDAERTGTGEDDAGRAFGACMSDRANGEKGWQRFQACLPLKPGRAHGVRAGLGDLDPGEHPGRGMGQRKAAAAAPADRD